MGNSQGQGKYPTDPSKDDTSSHHQHHGDHHHSEAKFHIPGFKVLREKTSGCNMCLKILFVILAIVVVLKSIVVIAVSISTAFATKIYNSEESGRLVAMVILAVTAAASLSIALYAMVAVFKRQPKPLHAAAVVLIILAVIQSVIVGVSVRVTSEDEVSLSRSLAESFKLARDDNPRHVKIWATTQHDLTCCGVYSAEDYRNPKLPPYFPPDVPISCCPSYAPDRSELVQERDREICKAKKQFYDIGCKNFVIEVFKETATVILSCTIALIVLEVFLSIIGSILSKEKNLLVVVTPEDGALRSGPAESQNQTSKADPK